MDAQQAQTKLKDLKRKARAARSEGKREAAMKFRAGARRMARKLRGLAPKRTEKKEE